MKESRSSSSPTEARPHDDFIGESMKDSAFGANLPKKDQKASQQVLYIVEETYNRSIMNVNVKLMNMELWVTSYENQPDDTAQILQLEFQSDLFYESESLTKELKCSANPNKAKIKDKDKKASQIPDP